VPAGDLSQRRKGDGEKVAIAPQLRVETTMSWKWIAQNLIMGSSQNAANCAQQNNNEEYCKVNMGSSGEGKSATPDDPMLTLRAARIEVTD
jgi:hypothetical protein